MATKNILVTGGAGYIGSHTTLQLLLSGFKVVVIDNLDNSSEIAINRVEELAGDFGRNLTFHKANEGTVEADISTWTDKAAPWHGEEICFIITQDRTLQNAQTIICGNQKSPKFHQETYEKDTKPAK